MTGCPDAAPFQEVVSKLNPDPSPGGWIPLPLARR